MELHVSERRICSVLGKYRSTQRKVPRGADDEEALKADIIELARQYDRYGYRRVTALLRDAGWHVNRKQVERIWRREGLKLPQQQPKRGRLWLNDGSCDVTPNYHPVTVSASALLLPTWAGEAKGCVAYPSAMRNEAAPISALP